MVGDALAGCCPQVGRIGRYTQIPMYKPYPIGYPAGDPGRGHFCIARVSRHAVPKTPGLLRYAYIYDPDRVSLPLAVPIASNALAGSRGKRMGAVHRSPLRG